MWGKPKQSTLSQERGFCGVAGKNGAAVEAAAVRSLKGLQNCRQEVKKHHIH